MVSLEQSSEKDLPNTDDWSKTIFSALGENEPVCVRPLWASVLLLLKRSQTDESIFEAVNFLKAFVPGLWRKRVYPIFKPRLLILFNSCLTLNKCSSRRWFRLRLNYLPSHAPSSC